MRRHAIPRAVRHGPLAGAAPLRRCYATADSARPLQGKKALVTGSTQGIGLGIATQLAKSGASVALNGFGDAAQIEKTRLSLRDIAGQEMFYTPADLSKASEVDELVSEARKKLGHIDILINNAGTQHVSPIVDFPPEKWEQVISVNLSAVFYAMRGVLPAMRQRGYGRVINISSVHGLVGSRDKSAYVAAKHGVVGLTKVAALEFAGSGVTCNCINPGWVLTDLVQKQIDAKAERLGISTEEARKLLLAEKQPSLTFATPEQIGSLCVFLCGEDASQITGACMPVDGGWTAQ